jgi:hypothetical protein
MKLLVFTKDEGPESRAAKELAAGLEEDKYQVEYLEADSDESLQRAELYDIYSFPSFVVVSDDGSQIERWRGTQPLVSDLKHFLSQ